MSWHEQIKNSIVLAILLNFIPNLSPCQWLVKSLKRNKTQAFVREIAKAPVNKIWSNSINNSFHYSYSDSTGKGEGNKFLRAYYVSTILEGLSHILSSQILTINMWYRYYKNNFIYEETDFHETKWFVKGDIINNDGTESQNYSHWKSKAHFSLPDMKYNSNRRFRLFSHEKATHTYILHPIPKPSGSANIEWF